MAAFQKNSDVFRSMAEPQGVKSPGMGLAHAEYKFSLTEIGRSYNVLIVGRYG